MFLKPIRVKSSSQTKGSDRKKFKATLSKRFPGIPEDALDKLVPTKEELIISKIQTHSGDTFLVYIQQKNPIFFEKDKEAVIFPTVYTLWACPNLLKYFTTWPPVLAKIAKGADLMLPGVIVDSNLGLKAYLGGSLSKGNPLAINTVSNRAAFAVGTAALSSEDMFMAGGRGKGVNILHSYGDELWALGTRQSMPELGSPEGLDFLKGKDGLEIDSDDEEDEEAADAQEPVCDETPADTGDELEQSQDPEKDSKVEEINKEVESMQLQEPERDAKEVMDELLENAFLQAWKTSAKKIDLPILTSNFFRVHMVPQCPKDTALDPKKSSYKKLSKFLEHMQKQKVIAIKELQKGVESIVQVDREHLKIQSFRVVKVAVPEPEADDKALLPAAKAYEPPVVEELLTVNAAVLPLFKQMGKQKGDALSHAEVRDLLRQFVSQKNLKSATDKAGVTLDDVMKDLVLSGDERKLEVATLKWDELISRVQAKMSSAYSVHFPGSAAPVVHKGKMEAIELTVHSRSGNKKVTLIHNLEQFGLDPKEVAHRCQVGVAASTSVGAAENRKPGSVEVLVQGNQLAFISKLLLNEYKIPRKFINGLEEPQKKKKGK